MQPELASEEPSSARTTVTFVHADFVHTQGVDASQQENTTES